MGWFWAAKYDGNLSSGSLISSNTLISSSGSSGTGCPVNYGSLGTNKNSVKGADTEAETKCPVNYGKFGSKAAAEEPQIDDLVLNPLNNMPVDISTAMAPGQKIKLSTEKTVSTIPKGENLDDGLWEYPSPQQMLNAMLRKGKGNGIPEDAVESMVEIHNFLNEGAWQEILEWEKDHTRETKIEPRLLQFTGRPNDLSPRASMFLWLSKWFPETFNSQPPFDRHDWTVLRSMGLNNGWSKIRYVIDYYSGPDDEETGMPTFILDTRPALDSPVIAYDRFVRWSGPIYKRAMGDFSDERK